MIEVLPNITTNDGDPRKMSAVRNLVKQFPEAITYWRNSGLLERGVETSKHKHGALSHLFAGGIAIKALSLNLIEKGVLNMDQANEAILAFLLHDADKPTDMKFINAAKEDEVSWSIVADIVSETDLENKLEILSNLKTNCERYFNSETSIGERIHVARAIIAEKIHIERLKAAGFSGRVIEIQEATEYTGCDEVDYLIDRYDELTGAGETITIQKVIVSYIDNCMKDSELTDPVKRAEAVFSKPINIDLNKAYKSWNKKNETAKEKQVRVSRKEEVFLGKLMGIEASNFTAELKLVIQTRLLK